MPLKKPLALKKGDIINIVAASSPFEKEAFEEGVQILQNLGLQVKFRPDIFSKNFHLAGDDKRRLTELTEAFLDPTTKAIFFARGGYGSMRLLPELNKKLSKRKIKPKIILGYSDVTAIQVWVEKVLKWTTFYGPVVAKDLSAKVPKENIIDFWRAITDSTPIGAIDCRSIEVLKQGNATAPLTGGCLSILCSLIGTPFAPNFDNKILFIEDVNEKPYEIERLLQQLKLAQKLKKICGVIVGSMNGPGTSDDYKRVILDVFHDFKIPIFFGFPAGHSERKMTLPLGTKIKMNTNKKEIIFLEPAIHD